MFQIGPLGLEVNNGSLQLQRAVRASDPHGSKTHHQAARAVAANRKPLHLYTGLRTKSARLLNARAVRQGRIDHDERVGPEILDVIVAIDGSSSHGLVRGIL